MKYLAFIVPSYAVALAVPLFLALTAWRRLRAAQRRVRALEQNAAP